MTFQPLIDAPHIVQIHVACAATALVLGTFVLYRRKGNSLHKLLGRMWAALMLLTAFTSFFIFGFRVVGPFGPIHLLSVFTIFGIVNGVRCSVW